ncbi:MAG: hypothetical protein AAF587_11270 [Bacteroidota bacterium]
MRSHQFSLMGFKDLYHLARDLFVGGIAGFSKRWASIHAKLQYRKHKQPTSFSLPIDKMDWHLFTASALVISALLWLCFLPMILMTSSPTSLSLHQRSNRLSDASTQTSLFPMNQKTIPLPQSNWQHKLQANPVPLNLSHIKGEIKMKQIVRITGLTGKVIAKVLVDKKGNYRNHYMVRSDHDFLRTAVETKIDQLTFSPGLNRGYPTARFAYVTFDFRE